MNFKRSKIWACSRLLATSFLGLFCAGGFLNLNMTMMVAHAEGRVFNKHCINYTNYNPQTKTLTIPPGYTEIENLGVAGVEIVNIPASITRIGGLAFRGCDSLTHVNIAPDSELKKIGFNAFCECTALETINLPEGLQEIGNNAFYDCPSLTSISIPDTVITIGDFAFGFCTSLREISLPNRLGEIAAGTFSKCSSLEHINIPDCVERIGFAAFRQCTSLKTIALPEKLQEIGESAFYECSLITDIDMPNTVSVMGHHVFADCASLRKVHLSKNLQEIPYGTFCGCSLLDDISVPKKVQEIERDAFKDCILLTNIDFPESLKIIHYRAFENCNSLELIKIPDHTKIMSPCGEEIDAPIIGKGTKIERFACDSSPNVSEGEEPRPRSFGGGFLGSMGLVQMRMMADVTTNRILRNRENMPLPSSPIPDRDNPFFEKTSKFKNPADPAVEETTREEQHFRHSGLASIGQAAIVHWFSDFGEHNTGYNHGLSPIRPEMPGSFSEPSDHWAFLDGHSLVYWNGIYYLI